MTDRKGNPINVGDRVFVIPTKTRRGGAGHVRDISIRKYGKAVPIARVDDGQTDGRTDDWTWSSWLTSDELEKI